MALIILDPTLESEAGHHLAYDLAIAREALARGQSVTIVSNRRFPARSLQGVRISPPFLVDDLCRPPRRSGHRPLRRHPALQRRTRGGTRPAAQVAVHAGGCSAGSDGDGDASLRAYRLDEGVRRALRTALHRAPDVPIRRRAGCIRFARGGRPHRCARIPARGAHCRCRGTACPPLRERSAACGRIRRPLRQACPGSSVADPSLACGAPRGDRAGGTALRGRCEARQGDLASRAAAEAACADPSRMDLHGACECGWRLGGGSRGFGAVQVRGRTPPERPPSRRTAVPEEYVDLLGRARLAVFPYDPHR